MMVFVFAVLLISSVFTFARRAVLDTTIVANRDATARAEALARGGVRLGIALLLEDRLRETAADLRVETRFDAWARAEALELPVDVDARLQIRVDDAGARLNLNALFLEGEPVDVAEILLVDLFDRVIDEADLRAGGAHDAGELARNLIDWIDADNVAVRGGFEDDAYQLRDPPYRAANRPVLSLDELRLVEGFDGTFVDALEPYVGVFPWAGGDGINPNTAPPWVLGLLYAGEGGDFRFVSVDAVEDLVRLREQGAVFCAAVADDPDCTPISDVLPGQIFPAPTWTTDVFVISAEARVRDVRRTVEAAVDRSDPAAPLVLSWRVR